MNKEPKISVIIPVYNCEKYLGTCLDSIVLQTYKKLEIICIDDGSKDRSLNILKNYAAKDDRIKVITQKNSGQSSARNRGLDESNGEYISFIDADDWVSLCLYEKFVSALNSANKDTDIFMFNACSYDEKQSTDNIEIKTFFNISEWVQSGSNTSIYTFHDCLNPYGGNTSAANKIYRTDFLKTKNIKFEKDLIFEDQLFYTKAFLKAQSIIINSEPLYRYRNSNTSSTTKSLGKNVFDIFEIIDKIEDEIKTNGDYEEYKYALFQHKYNQFSYLFFKTKLLHRESFYKKMKENLAKVQKEDFVQEILAKLTGYAIYEDILKMNMFDFYSKYKNQTVNITIT